MIGNLGHSTLHQASRDCDEVPKLMKHSLFKFSDCIRDKFNKHIKGNHKPKDNLLPSELCQMRCVLLEAPAIPTIILHHVMNTHPSCL